MSEKTNQPTEAPDAIRLRNETERTKNNLKFWYAELAEAEEKVKLAEKMIAACQGKLEGLGFGLEWYQPKPVG